MKNKRRLLVLTLLIMSILVIQTFALASAYYIPPGEDPPPSTRYRVRGTVRNADTNAYVSGALVKVYKGSSYLGSTTTSSTGYFNKYIYSTSPINFFTVKISKSGYYTKTVTDEVVGTTCNFGTILLTPTGPPAPPPAPVISNVQTTVNGLDDVSISWDMTWGSGATVQETKLWWGEDSGFAGVDPIIPTGVTHFEEHNLQVDYFPNEYWYKIEASNGNSGGTTYANPIGPNSVILKHYPTQDTCTYAEMPDFNFDEDPYYSTRMIVATGDPESPGLFEGWLKFSIDNPAHVLSATLRTYIYGTEPSGHGTITAYETGTNWDEASMDYAHSQSVSIGALLSSDTSGSAGSWDSWDVTSLASENEAISILLTPSGGQLRGAYYYTREYSDVSKRPYLEITYTDPTEYTITGFANDANTGDGIPDALVDIYGLINGYWTSLGTTTSDPSNGHFSRSYTTYDSIQSFKVIVRSAGYSGHEKIVAYSGNPYVSFQKMYLTPTHKTWIANDEFDYVWDAQIEDYVYSQFWEVNNPNNHETICNYGEANIFEISSPGATSSPGYMSKILDLYRWTGLGNLEVEIQVRVSSDYYGPDPITNLVIGIADAENLQDVKWSKQWTWEYTRDVNDVILSITIDKSDPNTFLEDYGLYKFFWGYAGSYSTFWRRSVIIDYFRISGEMVPLGALDKLRNQYITNPSIDHYPVNLEWDYDIVDVAYCTGINSQSTLGFGTVIPFIESGISISMDPDADPGGLGITMAENKVDSVTIKVEYFDWQGNKISNNIVDAKVFVNVEMGVLQDTSVAEGLLGVILEAIGLFGTTGSVVKFGAHALLWACETATTVEENSLTMTGGSGEAEATFDFGDTNGFLLGKGSTDFKMSFVSYAHSLTEDVYTISISYQVTIKQQRIWDSGVVSEVMIPLPLYTESLNYAYFPQEILNKMHMIEISSPIDGSLTLSKGTESRMYDTAYGSNMKIVRLRNLEESVTLSASVPSGYTFSKFWVYSWRQDVAIPPVEYNTNNPLTWTLVDGVQFYRFDAYYQ